MNPLERFDRLFEQRSIALMIDVCCGYFAYVVAHDTTLSAASITTKGNLGLRGGSMRADVARPLGFIGRDAVVRFHRPQPDSDSLLVAVESSSNGVQPSSKGGALSLPGPRERPEAGASPALLRAPPAVGQGLITLRREVRLFGPQPATLGCGVTGDPSPASNERVHESPSVATVMHGGAP